MPASPKVHSGILLLAFFLSGVAALVFEVLWVRQLTLTLGHTTLAVSIVLSAFMTGLAIGSSVGGKGADKLTSSQILLAYALLEFGICITGIFSQAVIGMTANGIPYLELNNTHPLLRSSIWFFISFFPLLLPTILMGATLPLLVRWYQLSLNPEKGANAVGLLYGLNTLGAVCGVGIAGFFLIAHFGLTQCYRIAGILNFISASLAFLTAFLRRNSGPIVTTKTNDAIPAETSLVKKAGLVLFLTGMAAMICEVAWTRLFSLVIGSSTYAFSLMLFTFLLGFATGSLLFKRVQNIIELNWNNLSWLLLLIGGGVLAYLPLFNKLPYYYSQLFRFTASSPRVVHLIQFALCAAVMFLPTFFMGMVLPWVTSILKFDLNRIGASFGMNYSFNTIGSILGSVLAGLFFIPVFGGEKSILIATWIYVATSFLIILNIETIKTIDKIGRIALIFVIFFIAALVRPPLDPLIISSGAFLYAPDYLNMKSFPEFKEYLHQNKLLFHADGVSSTVSVLEAPWHDRFLRVNGKTDASSRKDMNTQLLQGYLALALHPDQPKDTLLIGLGSGVSAAALAVDPGVERMDCVEIEPAMTKAAEFFNDVNHNVLSDPRFHLINTDARHYLVATNKKYDIISSEPSNPWIAGIANLFTKEAFETTKQRLKPNGIFCQWFHSYSMGLDDFKMVLHTFSSVFPHVLLFTTGDKDFFLVGSNEPWNINYKRLETLLATNAVMKNDLGALGLSHPFALIATTFLLDDADFRTFSSDSPLHIDDHPTLEFSAPRFLHRGQDRLIWESILSIKRNFLPSGLFALNPSKKEWGFLYNVAGEAFMRSRQLSQAEGAFQKALEFDPNNPRTWMNKARIHNLKNEHFQAEKALKRSLANEPSFALAWFHLGMLYLDQGLEENGIHSLEKGLAYSPGDPMGSLQLARMYWNKRRYEDGQKIIEKALLRPIHNADLYNNLVDLYGTIESEMASMKINPVKKI